MRVLIISDTPRDGWAIGKLSDVIIRNNPQIEIRFVAVHPKHVIEHLTEVEEAAKGVDLIHYQYWNSAIQLIGYLPHLKDIPAMLTHHNQKNTLQTDWNELGIKYHVVHTKKNAQKLIDAGYQSVNIIQHGIDLNYFTYNNDYADKKYVGYVGRIVPWKGLKEIAWAARQNGLRVLCMGKMDKPNYWAEIPEEDKAVIDFNYEHVPDDERINCYREMLCYVGNSVDDIEEGTLPLLEAMACGVPVITTPSGEAMDIINDNENGLLVPFENRDAIRVKIKMLLEDKELAERLRKNAWNSVKNLTELKMAREYAKLYYKFIFAKQEIVSVITPCFNNLKNLEDQFEALKAQSYPIAEWVIVDDNSDLALGMEGLVTKFRSEASFAIRYLNTHKDGYNLALARNLGIIESIGKYLMFLDGRIIPDPTAVGVFLSNYKANNWLFGDKGANKNAFVENFSFVQRGDVIKAGMFCERIDEYGGMSQEIRERWLGQGKEFLYVREATAKANNSSKMTPERRQSIIRMKERLYKMGF